jgi:membrane dipeptidase
VPIADLHCHYPMRLLTEEAKRDPAFKALTKIKERPRWRRKLKAALVLIAARLFNFRRFCDRWRVSLDRLERGDVRLVFSVLYDPFAEMDDEWPKGPPEDNYFEELRRLLGGVETDLHRIDPDFKRHVLVKDVGDLDPVDPSDKRIRFVHCIEGGFHLGGTVSEIENRVAELAGRGVAYITLAHLFWRQVSTNAPALPFLTDRQYERLFPQPKTVGLDDLGRAAVRAMHKHRVLIDISHMSEPAIEETFALLAELYREHGTEARDFPVIATHAGYRFDGGLAYMLSDETIEKIAARDGVIGLIMANHQLNHHRQLPHRGGLRRTLRTIRDHVDAIHRVTGSYEQIGIGSDLDGFIKPTVGGIEYADDLVKLVAPLRKAFPDGAEAILRGNALRVLEKALARPAY